MAIMTTWHSQMQLRNVFIIVALFLVFCGLYSENNRNNNGRARNISVVTKVLTIHAKESYIPEVNKDNAPNNILSQNSIDQNSSIHKKHTLNTEVIREPNINSINLDNLKNQATGFSKYNTGVTSIKAHDTNNNEETLDIGTLDLGMRPRSESEDTIKSRYRATTLSTPVTTKSPNAPPNCKALFEGDKKEARHVKRFLKHHPYKSPPDSYFTELAQDCGKFKGHRGYHEEPVSEEEAEYPIAFAIRMHNKVAQAEQLFRTVYMPQNVYCIYVDKKADQNVHKAMTAIANCFPNVYMASHIENFIYQTFSPVEADLQCMKDLLNTSVNWKYFINMAGTEFPLRTNLEMVRILKMLNGTNDVEQYPFPKEFHFRINEKYTVNGNDIYPLKEYKKPFSPALELQKGCSYNLFSREFVKWILSDKLAQDFISWSKDTMAPDEVVWATLNHLPQAPGGYPDMVTQIAKTMLAREVIWQWSNAYCWGQHFVHGICILSSADLHWLSRRWEFLANKFDLEFDHVVVDCLEERHRNRTLNPDPEHNINWKVVSDFPQMRATRRRNASVSKAKDST